MYHFNSYFVSFLQIQLFFTLLIITLTTSLKTAEDVKKEKKNENAMILGKVVKFLIDSKLRSKNRRALNPVNLAKARDYYKALTKDMGGHNKKKVMRSRRDPAPKALRTDEHSDLVETELKLALTHKKSALFDRPYVEKHGKNDYLVLRPEVVDPFVTVVPNHMYYNIEKKCVNWLDDCSLRGIRARLLRGANSPHK